MEKDFLNAFFFNRFTGTTSEKLAGFENGLFPIFTQIIQRDVTGMQLKCCRFDSYRGKTGNFTVPT